MGSHYRESDYNLYLGYSESRSGGEALSDEQYCDHADAHIEFQPEGLYTEKSSTQETVGVDFDPTQHVGADVYMVVVRYYDGDTFGRCYGHWFIEGIYLDRDEALKNKNAIESGSYSKKGCYNDWEGYFAGLESVNVWGTQVREGECSGIRWF